MRLITTIVILSLAVAAPALGQDDETETVRNTSGQLRMLVQRASRQYMMYQYGVGDLNNSKEPLLITAQQIDETLRRMRAGETIVGAQPITEAGIIKQIDVIKDQWTALDRIYRYQPYKLFQAKELLPPAVRKEDPVLVRYVDRLSQDVLAQCDKLIHLYTNYCELKDSRACNEFVRETGHDMQLIEAVTRDVLFIILDIDRDQRRKQLATLAAELDAALQGKQAQDHFGAGASGLIAPVMQTILAYWRQMKVSVDAALNGNESDVDVRQLLRSQRGLLDEIDNLSIIVAGR